MTTNLRKRLLQNKPGLRLVKTPTAAEPQLAKILPGADGQHKTRCFQKKLPNSYFNNYDVINDNLWPCCLNYLYC